jgi:hypothetical protein
MPNVTPSITPCKRESRPTCSYINLISNVLDSARTALRYQFIIDALDVLLPATNLGFIHLNDGILGFTG